MFEIYFDPEFMDILEDLKVSQPDKHDSIIKKIKQVAEKLEWSPKHYKNLKYPLNKYRRTHVNTPYVLVFRVNEHECSVLFVDYDHHDNIYKKKRLFNLF
jgi:YafQ family addiction module toxin component